MKFLKLPLYLFLGISTAVTATAFSPMPERVRTSKEKMPAAPAERFGGMQRIRPLEDSEGNAVSADFTIAGADAVAPVFTEKFDAPVKDWEIDATSEVKWSMKQAGAPGTAKSFSAIDPDDKTSLFVEGPYQVYKREKSSATSPAIDVPVNGSLSFYTGFSLNYDDECRLLLDVIAGTDTVRIWDSSKAPGEKPWAWRKIDLDISKYAGRQARFRFTYGSGAKDAMFDAGGYMGDFYIDAFTVSGLKPVESIEAMTGEMIGLVDISSGDITEWSWSMPGAVPATSSERNPQIYYTRDGNYDITLTVKDAAGNTSSKTRTAFAHITGTKPVAEILPPATFRYSSTRLPMVAPLVPVRYTDASAGFPDAHRWTFTGVDAVPEKIFESTEANPEVAYAYLHRQTVGLESANDHGSSAAVTDVSVEYSGVVNNLRPADKATTFDMEDWGIFPGSNTRKITAYAERFSRPSRPVRVSGAYVYFTRAEATELVDQIQNVGVHLYTSENGLPGKHLDSMWWSVFELDTPSTGGDLVGTAFEFTGAPVVDDEFFIVVDGLPEFKEGCCVSFGMAGFRQDGNTALILKEGKWMEVPEYFGAGKSTSFMIYPAIAHSVMTQLPVEAPLTLEAGKDAAVLDFPMFSYLGYETPAKADADWLRLEGKPNGLTVDTLHIAVDELPASINERVGHLTLTDGASELTVTVKQTRDEGGIDGIGTEKGELTAWPSPFTSTLTVGALTPGTKVELYALDGRLVLTARADAEMIALDTSALSPGIYILRAGDRNLRLIRK